MAGIYSAGQVFGKKKPVVPRRAGFGTSAPVAKSPVPVAQPQVLGGTMPEVRHAGNALTGMNANIKTRAQLNAEAGNAAWANRGQPPANPSNRSGEGYAGFGGAQNTGGASRPSGSWTNDNQYAGMNPFDTALNLSKEERQALGGYRNYRESSGRIGQLPSTTEDYNRVSGGAGDYLDNMWDKVGGTGGQPDMGFDPNDFRNQGRDLINNAPGQQPNAQRPDLMGPGGGYQKPDVWGQMSQDTGGGANRFTDTAYDVMRNPINAPSLNGVQNYNRPGGPSFNYANQNNGQFDPNSVSGPNVTPIAGSGLSLGGNAGTPGWQDALNAAKGMGGGPSVARENLPGPVGRETIGGSGFQSNELFTNPNSVANRGFNASLAANQGLANANMSADTGEWDAASKAAADDTMARAALAGRNAAGARGFTAAEGTIAGGEMGTRLGEAARQIAADRTKTMLDSRTRAAELQGQQRMAGASNLTGLGSAASEAGVRGAGLLQDESQFLGGAQLQQREGDITQNRTAGELAIRQREGDIDMAKLGATLGGQNLSGVADIIRATGGESTDYERMLNERARLGLDTGVANANAGTSTYEAQTGRMGTLGGIKNTEAANRTSQFASETERAQGEQQARQAANELGYNYDSMDATQRDNLNQRLNQQYGIQVDEKGQVLNAAASMTQTLGSQNLQGRELEEKAREFAASEGRAYDTLTADEKNQYNQRANERYQTDVTAELGRGQQAGQNYQTQLNAASDFYQTDAAREGNYLAREQEMGRQGIDAGRLANDILQNKTTAQQAANELVTKGIWADMDQAMRYLEERTRQEQNRWMTNHNNQASLTGNLIGGYMNAGSSIGSAIASNPGSVAALSDINLKENIVPIDGADVLARIESLSVSQWNYKGDDPSKAHIGPMAQDFHAAFPINPDDTHIDLLTSNGVILAAIQELAARVKALEARA